MLASLITAFFILVGGFAILAMLATRHRYAGAWEELARERRSPDNSASPEMNYPCTVNAHCVEEPSGAIVYQGRFIQKAGWLPLQTGLRAAA